MTDSRAHRDPRVTPKALPSPGGSRATVVVGRVIAAVGLPMKIAVTDMIDGM